MTDSMVTEKAIYISLEDFRHAPAEFDVLWDSFGRVVRAACLAKREPKWASYGQPVPAELR